MNTFLLFHKNPMTDFSFLYVYHFSSTRFIQSNVLSGKMLDLIVDYDFSPGEVSVNHSFICRTSLTTKNVTANMDKADYGAPVTSTLKNIQIQAFNKIKNEPDFVDCEYPEPKVLVSHHFTYDFEPNLV